MCHQIYGTTKAWLVTFEMARIPLAILLGVDSPFFSTIVLSKNPAVFPWFPEVF